MERSELFKAAAEKAAEVMELFPSMEVDLYARLDRVSVWFSYRGDTDVKPIYMNKPEVHEEAVRDIVKKAAAFVVKVLCNEQSAVVEERDALAAKLEVMESQKEGGSHEA